MPTSFKKSSITICFNLRHVCPSLPIFSFDHTWKSDNNNNNNNYNKNKFREINTIKYAILLLCSLPHSRFLCRHAMLLPTKWGGALRDDSKNGCVAD